MARAYHNLAGFVRDLTKAYDDLDDEYAQELCASVARYVGALLAEDADDDDGDPGVETSTADAVEQRQTDLDLRDDRDGSELEPSPAGHDPMCPPPLVGDPGLVTAALGHARASAASSAAAIAHSGTSTVERTRPQLNLRSVGGS